MDKNTFVLLYKATVRSHLEYVNSVWCPWDIVVIEKVQKSDQHLPHIERLKQLKLPTLKYRHLRET